VSALSDGKNALFVLVDEDEPLAAALSHKQVKAMDIAAQALKNLPGSGDWDPKLHPRNPNTGEFIDKGTSIVKISKDDIGHIIALDPSAFNDWFIKIGPHTKKSWDAQAPGTQKILKNLAAKYAAAGQGADAFDLIQVFEHVATHGKLTGIKWDAPLKLDELGQSDFFDWFHDIFVSGDSHHDKQAWNELSTKQKGEVIAEVAKLLSSPHTTDAYVKNLAKKINQLEGTPVLKVDTPPSAFVPQPAQPIGVGTVPVVGVPLKINTPFVYKTAFMNNTIIAEKLQHDPPLRIIFKNSKFHIQSQDASGTWATPSVGLTQKLGIAGPYGKPLGKGELYKAFKNDVGWTSPLNTQAHFKTPSSAPPLSAETQAVIEEIKMMSGPEFVGFMDDNYDEILAMWNTAPDEEKKVLKDKATEVLTHPKANGFVSPSDKSYLKPYQQLQEIEKQVSNMLKSTTPPKGAVYGTSTFAVPGNLNTYSNVNINQFYDSITQADWDSFDKPTKTYLQKIADQFEHDGNDEPGAALIALKNNEGPGSPWASMPTLSQMSPEISKMDSLQFKEWLDNQTAQTLSELNHKEQVHLFDVAANHTLTNYLHDVISSTASTLTDPQLSPQANPNVPSTPNVPTTPGVPGNPILQSIHENVHVNVKPIGQIGTPISDDQVGAYASITPLAAQHMQAEMLKQSGKTWTSAEINSVAKYTTSEGYQSMNAVLRNDQVRMKKFSQQALKAAGMNARDLQNAMTPTTTSLQLFRGTGAHAFGFDSDHAPSLDALKALEGKLITDRGFTSTSIVDKTGVGWDYTKKPIRIEIKVPKGAPALYVSSATPGYKTEEELILGAGTTFRIDEVRAATAAEKAKHGGALEHVVSVTVVPRANHPGPKKFPSSVASPLSAVDAAQVPQSLKPNPSTTATPGAKPKVGGTPFKFNTSTIYKVAYTPGQTVAERPGPDGDIKMVWNVKGKTGKFQLWKNDPNLNKWLLVKEYGKGDAYTAFKNDSGWFEPGSVGQPDLAQPLGLTVSPKKISKYDANAIKAEHGDTYLFGYDEKESLYQHFKKNTSLGFIMLNTQPPTVFKALALAVAKWNKDHPADHMNMLQGIKIIDEFGHIHAPAGTPKQTLWETKVVDWLTTASGKKNAAGFINWAEDYVNAPTSTTSSGAVVHLKLPIEIGTPDASETNFPAIKSAEAMAMHKKAMTKHGVWNKMQTDVIYDYTGSGSGYINGALRSGNTNGSGYQSAIKMQSAMYPAEKSFQVFRNTESVGAAFNGYTLEDWQKMVGQTLLEPGFSSTAVGKSVFGGRKFHLEIEVPKGTPGAYVKSASANAYENEYIIAAGTKFRVLSVAKKPGIGSTYGFNIRLRVVS